MDEDDFLIDDDDAVLSVPASYALLIVDDEPAIHDVTRMALRGVRFDQHEVEMLSAYSAAEALQVLVAREDIAVILLDVVMETESAGLDLVRTIRDDLGNANVRIILRTGQPGQGPEERVFADYDINDYKAKAELTRRQMVTCIYSALRSWRDLQVLQSRCRSSEQLAGQRGAVIKAVLGLIDVPAAVLDGSGAIMVGNQALAALELKMGIIWAAVGGDQGTAAVTAPLTTADGRRWSARLKRVASAGSSGDGVSDANHAVVLRLDPAD
ncbi:hypothetical protein WCLP8_5210008 [uncultured Gammaproteobacteria bacterium]